MVSYASVADAWGNPSYGGRIAIPQQRIISHHPVNSPTTRMISPAQEGYMPSPMITPALQQMRMTGATRSPVYHEGMGNDFGSQPIRREYETNDIRLLDPTPARVPQMIRAPAIRAVSKEKNNDNWKKPKGWTLVIILLLSVLLVGTGLLLAQNQRLHMRLDQLLLSLGGPLHKTVL